MYETSAGSNTALIIDFAPFPNGSLPSAQVALAQSLGKYVQLCYNHPVLSLGPQSGQTVLILSSESPVALDRVMVQEDQVRIVVFFNIMLDFC